MDAAHALAALKGAHDERFPRQKEYVAAFFLDTGSRKKPAPEKQQTPPPPANGAPATP